jgi:23S rRNA pseudouridine1911/1915/1917 synthase
MKYIKHPLFNDAVYGGDQILKGTIYSKYKQFVQNCFNLMPRQALHAKTLGFIHPTTKEYVRFDSPLPPDFTAVLDKWRKYIVISD